MFDGVLHRNSCRVGAGNARERQNEVFFRLGNRCQVDRRAGSRDVGDGCRSRKLRHTAQKAPGVHVHSQPVEMEEIRSKDSLLDVRHNKNPPKAASQTQTDGEAPGTVCGDAATIDSRQRVLREGRVGDGRRRLRGGRSVQHQCPPGSDGGRGGPFRAASG